jgi:hypothetical protein
MYIPAKENINKVNELLTGELSGAAGIKSKQTRTSVCTAITSTKESKLKFVINQSRTKTVSQHSTKRFSPFLWSHRNGRWQD